MDTVVTEEYGADQIQVLEGLEAVRKRPGMYIGSTGPRGLHHLVYEIVDNSIDEALAGFCTHIEVEILPGNIISVRDNGRGIPVAMHEKMGIPTLTVVLTVLHAGGKFGGSGYKVSGGLHGVGSSVVNALSEWMEAEVSRDGHVHYQKFSRGNAVCDMKIIGDTNETGTLIRFKPDPEIFTETTEYDFDVLERRLRESAFLNAGL
ncbi:MAG: ATP-binding protein, partial [Acutalibacteraceae bacterium]|nr:ATP-binding protein [Acutalibacteraceae bacterium]